MRQLLLALLLAGSVAGVAFAASREQGPVLPMSVDAAGSGLLFEDAQSQWMLGLGLAGLGFAGRRRD